MPELESASGQESLADWRGPATRRLLVLDQRGELTDAHVKVVAECVNRSFRTVRRWVAAARADGRCERKDKARFIFTDDLRAELASLGGNISHLHRELKDREKAGGPTAPALRTLYRAVERQVTRGELAGLRHGEKARRMFDVHLRRPKGPGNEDKSHRNLVWEADHVEASVRVEVDGRLLKPWVTWFVDCAHDAICGVAITPDSPSRESILVALRSSILRDDHYGPVGGLPTAIRVDRGADFLSNTVGSVLGRFAIPVGELPGYCPHLKGTVENLNKCVKTMLFNTLPHYVHAPTKLNGKPYDPDAPALTFEAFVTVLLEWVNDWNRVMPKPGLGGLTPEQSWLADPWPVDEVPAADLRLMMLEDDGRTRKITPAGISWRSRMYAAGWMTGRAETPIRLRYMLHHDHEVEVFHAGTGKHLGVAHLQDRATPQQVADVMRARQAARKRVERDLRKAAKLTRQRYAAVTVAQPAQRLGALTSKEADAELGNAYTDRLTDLAKPGLFPLPEPDPGWVVPGQPPGSAAGGQDEEGQRR